MPTGYTAPLLNGEITTFRDFAIECSKAFGVYVDFRDTPNYKPEEEIGVGKYYTEAVTEHRDGLASFDNKSNEDLIYEYLDFFEEDQNYYRNQLEKDKEQNAILARMIEQVTKWVPPSPEHLNIKTFMIEQLTISHENTSYYEKRLAEIEKKEPITFDAWIAKHRRGLVEAVGRAEKNLKDEEEKVIVKNRWIKTFRDSLPSA